MALPFQNVTNQVRSGTFLQGFQRESNCIAKWFRQLEGSVGILKFEECSHLCLPFLCCRWRRTRHFVRICARCMYVTHELILTKNYLRLLRKLQLGFRGRKFTDAYRNEMFFGSGKQNPNWIQRLSCQFGFARKIDKTTVEVCSNFVDLSPSSPAQACSFWSPFQLIFCPHYTAYWSFAVVVLPWKTSKLFVRLRKHPKWLVPPLRQDTMGRQRWRPSSNCKIRMDHSTWLKNFAMQLDTLLSPWRKVGWGFDLLSLDILFGDDAVEFLKTFHVFQFARNGREAFRQ